MPDISLTMVVVLCLTAFAAGWIDAVVGGGGLFPLPVLLLGLPAGTPAAYALGTDKAVAIVGTSGAAVTYARKAPVDERLAVRIGVAAFIIRRPAFYDGLIGPGTGTFLVLACTAVLHLDLVTGVPMPEHARCSPGRAPSCGSSPP